MAQRYGWDNLENKLVNFEYCSLERLKQIEGFNELSVDSQLKLAAKRIPKAVTFDGSQAAFRLIHEIIAANKEDDSKKNKNETTLFEGRTADWIVTSSGGEADETSFLVHSKILQFYSQVSYVLQTHREKRCVISFTITKEKTQSIILELLNKISLVCLASGIHMLFMVATNGDQCLKPCVDARNLRPQLGRRLQ